jgi:hypothetical protein
MWSAWMVHIIIVCNPKHGWWTLVHRGWWWRYFRITRLLDCPSSSNLKTRKHYCTGTGSVSILMWGVAGCLLCSVPYKGLRLAFVCVLETGSVSILSWRGKEDTYSVGSFRKWLRLGLSIWPNGIGVFPPHLRMETDSFSETSCFLVSRIPDDGKGPKPQ